jgi:SAM-dependent methyltransferase
MSKEQYLNSIRGHWTQTYKTHIGLHPNPEFIAPMDFIPQELLDNSKLFSNRNKLMEYFKYEYPQKIAEVGVQEGFFNEFINDTFNPKELYAIDIDITQYTSRTIIKDNVIPINKPSQNILASDFSSQLDLVYLDADHSYDAAKKDIEILKDIIKPGGLFVFNDFTMFSVHEMLFYGVARAVTEFIIKEKWQVVALALDEWNFYDIALRKPNG